MATLTEWFTRDPEHVGWYQIGFTRGVRVIPTGFRYWNGEYWSTLHDTPAAANQVRLTFIVIRSTRWRGLADPPCGHYVAPSEKEELRTLSCDLYCLATRLQQILNRRAS